MAGAYVGLGIILIFHPRQSAHCVRASFGNKVPLFGMLNAGHHRQFRTLFTGHTMFLTLGVKLAPSATRSNVGYPAANGSATGRLRLCRPALQLGRRQLLPVDTSIVHSSRAGENHRARHGTVLQKARCV